MNNRTISLKSQVRYDGRAQTIDRRSTVGADLEKIPDPVWRTVGLVLRTQLRKAAQSGNTYKPPGLNQK
jgi:hypothetical protein